MIKINRRSALGLLAVSLLLSCNNNLAPIAQPITAKTIQPEETVVRPVPTVEMTNSLALPLGDNSQTLLEENYLHIRSIPVASRSLEEISEKYLKKQFISPAQEINPIDFSIGDSSVFTIHNDDNEQYYQIEAFLYAETNHAYLWAQEELQISPIEAQQVLEIFEEEIYPNNTQYFGFESTPGMDGDAHIFILYTQNLGTYVGGYFSADDAAPRSLNEYSNVHEMIYINAANVSLYDSSIFMILAHEHQHMIQYNQDKNEETWISEGAAEFAAYINGYYDPWNVYSYLIQPDIPLIGWNEDMAKTGPYYAGGFLFTAYFADRFGSQTMLAMINSQETGLFGIENALAQSSNVSDSMTDFSVLFGDWAIANLINDASLENGRYSYQSFNLPTTVSATEEIKVCPFGAEKRTINQFGVDFIEISCAGAFTLEFTADSKVPLIQAAPHSGSYAMWSNLGNESSMTMTKEFDFSLILDEEIILTYWTWYDIEKEYDYVYALVSTDMVDWQVLQPDGCLAGRYSFGCGLTGDSNGWMMGDLDLTDYAGKVVFVQFEYLTDLAVNGQGLMIDDIRIEAINYYEDFETGNGGWFEKGFARISMDLPQTFQIALVSNGMDKKVTHYTYLPGTILSIPIRNDPDRTSILVVAATTPFSKFEADYSISITN